MFEDPPSWKRDPLITGTILFFLLLSPVGAPLMAFVTIASCGLSWDGPYQCVIPEPLFTYFMIFTLGPLFFLGYFGLAWMLLCFAAIIGFACLFVRAAWEAFADWW